MPGEEHAKPGDRETDTGPAAERSRCSEMTVCQAWSYSSVSAPSRWELGGGGGMRCMCKEWLGPASPAALLPAPSRELGLCNSTRDARSVASVIV